MPRTNTAQLFPRISRLSKPLLATNTYTIHVAAEVSPAAMLRRRDPSFRLIILLDQILSGMTVSGAKHLHHLVPKVIDHLDRNPSRLRAVERPRGIAMQRLP